MGLTYIFITHDLSVVNHFANDIAVMYLEMCIRDRPITTSITVRVIPEGSARAIALETGEVDLVWGVDPTDCSNICLLYTSLFQVLPSCSRSWR